MHQAILAVTREMAQLRQLTKQVDWTPGLETRAVAIGDAVYEEALGLAIRFMRAVPHAGLPVVGADPDGYLWLTWEHSEGTRFSLAMKPHLFEWDRVVDGMPKTETAESVFAVVEALKATFSRHAPS